MQAKQDPETKKWTVVVNVKSKDGGEEKHTFIVKHLVFATGFVGEPHMPELPGREKYKGTVLHSSQHRTATDHAGKKVLVIGACTSGMLISSFHKDLSLTATCEKHTTFALTTSSTGSHQPCINGLRLTSSLEKLSINYLNPSTRRTPHP